MSKGPVGGPFLNDGEPKINLNKDFYMFFGFGLYFNKS